MNAITSDYSDPSGRNVGIDVGTQQLDIFIHELDKYWAVENSRPDICTLITQLRHYNLARVVVEATGGYERAFVEAGVERSLPVVVVQPMRIRQFAKAQGILAKTDKRDAATIAYLGVMTKCQHRCYMTVN